MPRVTREEYEAKRRGDIPWSEPSWTKPPVILSPSEARETLQALMAPGQVVGDEITTQECVFLLGVVKTLFAGKVPEWVFHGDAFELYSEGTQYPRGFVAAYLDSDPQVSFSMAIDFAKANRVRWASLFAEVA